MVFRRWISCGWRGCRSTSSYDKSAEAPELHQADPRRKNRSAPITAWDIPEGANRSAVEGEEDEGLRLRQVVLLFAILKTAVFIDALLQKRQRCKNFLYS